MASGKLDDRGAQSIWLDTSPLARYVRFTPLSYYGTHSLAGMAEIRVNGVCINAIPYS